MKNRRFLAGIICILSLLLVWSLFQNYGTSIRLNDLSVSETDFNNIISSRKLDEEFDISSLRINGDHPFRAQNSIYYSIIEGDNQGLNPKISIDNSKKLAITGEGISAESIEHGESIPLIIYNDSSYIQLTLITTTLPMISFNFEGGQMPVDRDDNSFTMEVYDNRQKAFRRKIVSDGTAHKRGGSSYTVNKSSLSLSLTNESIGENTRDNPISLLGMAENSNYVLSGMYFDYEKVRDVFNSTLWSRASNKSNSFELDLSYDWRYVEVIANNEYQGLYILGRKPDEALFEVNTEDTEHPDILFKAAEGADFGPFIIGKDNTFPNYELQSDTDIQFSYNVLRDYIRVMFGDNTEEMMQWSDYDNAIDYWIFANLTQNDDIPRYQGMVKNTYICFKWDGSHYKAVYIPWDHDFSFGTRSPYANSLYAQTYDQNVFLNQDLVDGLTRNGDNSTRTTIQNRYWKLRGSCWSDDKINGLIDSLESQIFDSGALSRDANRWPDSHYIDAEVKLSRFREFVINRAHYLETDMFNEEKTLNPRYTIPNYIKVFLDSGIILSPDDPEYIEKLPEEEIYGDKSYYDESDFSDVIWF